MNCVVCAKSTKNTTKCPKCKGPFCTACMKHRVDGRCPGCARPGAKPSSSSLDFGSNDFESPELFAASDGFSYLVIDGSVPYRVVPKNQGMYGFAPQVKRITESVQQNFNPDNHGEDDLDEEYTVALAEYRCHGGSGTSGTCETCGLELRAPSWDGRNAFEAPEEPVNTVSLEESVEPGHGAVDPASSNQPEPLDWSVGDRVMATWKHVDSAQYAATIVAANPDGTVELHYDDGSKDDAVPVSYLKSALPPLPEPVPEVLITCAAGDRVMATWKGPSGTTYAARVVALNDDGETLHLAYDDGSVDTVVPFVYVKSIET